MPILRERSLHNQITDVLSRKFAEGIVDYRFGEGRAVADFLVRDGNKVAIVEIKTGDPHFPLPSSTSSQLTEYVAEARRVFADPNTELIPVVVTNYLVPDGLEEDLQASGVKLLRFDSPAAEKGLPQAFAELVGFNLPLATK